MKLSCLNIEERREGRGERERRKEANIVSIIMNLDTKFHGSLMKEKESVVVAELAG